ncbi:ankyrin repeat protein [Fadolivirus algeromassiliense]|jgi:ankyrin repeat protein|uniref:Ankyrin repeat protein n=1 Tax=Fadolivirus FV1/VV64 TaxID=3070911 RepID=A0A7D3R1G5_9VIRU|nr:ankyrin repeat protein [Fadolivirus algeromassiliense]QKF94482.1 ankyrin repeat protein [Fadolivirus FV1/VV64]
MESEEFLTELRTLIEMNDGESNNKIISLIEDKNIYDILYVHGENLLHWAAAFNNAVICEYLLKDKKLHVNLENFRGATPLYYAAMKNSLEAVEVLMRYNANPRIRSGFSGLFPMDVTQNDQIKEILEEVDNTSIPLTGYGGVLKCKNNFSKYVAYRYRLYMWWLSNLNYYNNKYKHTISGTELIPEAKTIYDKDGITGLAEKCQRLYDDYIDSLEYKEFKCCLYCSNNIDLKRCSKCKSVYYCNQTCQSHAYKIHKIDCI